MHSAQVPGLKWESRRKISSIWRKYTNDVALGQPTLLKNKGVFRKNKTNAAFFWGNDFATIVTFETHSIHWVLKSRSSQRDIWWWKPIKNSTGVLIATHIYKLRPPCSFKGACYGLAKQEDRQERWQLIETWSGGRQCEDLHVIKTCLFTFQSTEIINDDPL